MPTIAHAAFLGSFITTFVVLYLLSSFISAQLRARGWDIRDIILIGLDKKDFGNEPPPEMLSFSTIVETIKLEKSAQVAVAAGFLTVVYLLTKLVKPSTCRFLYNCISCNAASEKKPVLDPQEWKEFPLVAKFNVSPNTAL